MIALLTELRVKQRHITLVILFTWCSFVAADQEGEDEEEEDEEEDEEDEDDDNEEEDEDEEDGAQEKNLKKMEEQRSQGKVRGCQKVFSVAASFFFVVQLSYQLCHFQSLQVKVTPGKMKVEDPARLEQEEKAEEKRLAIMMMKKKEKYLYDKIMFGKKRKIREVCWNFFFFFLSTQY